MTAQQRTTLLELVKKGNIQEALDLLLSLELEESKRKEAVALASRYSQLKHRSRLGILSLQDLNITENQVISSLINLINYPDDVPFATPKSVDQLYPTRPILWKYIAMTALLLLILASLAELLDFMQLFPRKSSDEKLQLTLFVTDSKGNVALENEGRINISLGNRPLNEIIGANGRTNFPDITTSNKGDTILIGLEAEGWEIADGKNTFVFDGTPIHLKVRRDDSLGTIQGVVRSRDGQLFIAGAYIRINTDTIVQTDEFGVFKIVLPASMRVKKKLDRYLLTVTKEGYEVVTEYYSPKSSDAEIRLIKIE